MLETTTYSHVWILLGTLVVAVPAILAIIATLRSRSLRLVRKTLWTVLLLVPVVGVVVWLIVRPTGFTFTRRRVTTP
ncbi:MULTISPECIES: PLDc N-terminal domain-containing protein [Curtobacterium]|uniref:PLDc N-terminal domain-containing protein n=1 Tax=Curtobacterium TaxID=2034 RepID=UPI00158702FB